MKVIPLNIKYFSIFLTILNISCLSIKPIYNADEQTKAEQGVNEYHIFYNEKNFEGMYNLFSPEAKEATNKDNFIRMMKEGFEKFGKIQSATLSEAKVLPGSPIQVRMIYNVKFASDEAQEWFVWVNRDNKSQLLQMQSFPGQDKPESRK